MLVEKEIVAPGSYWYSDEKTGVPRRLDVSPELTKYWCDQGTAMIKAGLPIPVPFEHDFNSHPMTPRDKLLNNAGEVKEYRLKGDTLFGVVDVTDPDAQRKIGHSIRWTSPWINSFVDGDGKKWDNVISHLALTTRPRITKQAPFGSIAAALSMATYGAYVTPATGHFDATRAVLPAGGICLSKAGRLAVRKRDKRLCPRYPIAFSLFSGAALGEDDLPPKKEKKKPESEGGDADANPTPGESEFEGEEGVIPDGDPTNDSTVDLPPLNDPAGDVGMEEVLCDLLSALGIHCEHSGNEDAFKRSLYTAAMTKIHELTAKAQAPDMPQPGEIGKQNPAPPTGATNPLIQQEQQPMYMSLGDIQKISDPTMKSIALAMYNENVKLRAEVDAGAKVTNSLRDAKLKEAAALRTQKVTLLSKLSPRVKADLEGMLALPSMALSMGDGGSVNDPMAQTLQVLEKGLADMPRLLTTDSSAFTMQPHPTDADALSDERANEIADSMARMMGCPPEKKAS